MAPTVTPTCFFQSDISQYRIVRSCVPPIGLSEPYLGVSDIYTRRNGQSVVNYNFDCECTPYLEDGALVRRCTSRPMFILISLRGRPLRSG